MEGEKFDQELRAFSSHKERHPDKPWGFLPPFADDANRALHASILDLEESLERLDEQIDAHTTFTKTIVKHTENVKQEIQFTNSQLNAKNKEMETEEHLKKLAQRETGRLESESKKLQREQSALEETIHNLELNLFSGNESLDKFKQQMNFNAEELERWIKEREKNEEDRAILEKYKRQDESLVKNLNLQIQNLNRQTIKTKEELEHEMTETQALQVQLEKTAEDFRKSHNERVALLKQWNEAVETLKQRDQNIEDAEIALKDRHETIKEREELVKTLERDLNTAESKYKDLELELQNKERQLSSLRESLRMESEQTLAVNKEGELLKNAHIKAEKELEQKQNENQNCVQQLQQLRKSLSLAAEKFEQTKLQVEKEKSRLEDLELRDSEYQNKVQTEERRLRETKREVNDLRSEQYKIEQTLSTEKQQESDLLADISGISSQDKNLTSRIAQMDEAILKQEEILYNISFKVVMMERKVERASGIRSQTETRELQNSIQTLTTELERVNSEHLSLISQLRRTEHELDQAQKRSDQQSQEQAKLEMGVSEIELDALMIEKQIRERQEEKENIMIEEAMLNLQVRRLKNILHCKSSEVSSLESKKQVLKSTITEKKTELASQQDCLKFELKNVRDEVHRVRVELSDRRSRSEKLRLKHGTLLSKKESLFDTEPKSREYYMIRAAQEKEELKQEGTQFDIRIKVAEKEVLGLENALRGIVLSNQDYKQSIKSGVGSDLLELRCGLSEELDVAYDQLKYRRSEESRILGETKQAEESLFTSQQDVAKLTEMISELKEKLEEADHQLKDQIRKETRARNRAKKLLMESEAKESIPSETVKLSVVQDLNRSVLSDLKTAAMNHQCPIATAVVQELESNGINMPNSTSCRSTPRSSRPNSTQSQRPGSGASASSVAIKQMHLNI